MSPVTQPKDNTTVINAYKQQLMFISQQKQQMQFQANVFESTIKELEKTKEKKVFKGVGNIFIQKDVSEVLTETKDTIDTINQRIKTLEKQEAESLKKLNELTRKDDKPGKKGKEDSEEDDVEGIA